MNKDRLRMILRGMRVRSEAPLEADTMNDVARDLRHINARVEEVAALLEIDLGQP